MLESLEAFRGEVAGLFEHVPEDIAVVLHPRSAALTLAHPWLPLARRVSAPAGRRYFAGWFSETDIHVLSPPALEPRASNVEGRGRPSCCRLSTSTRTSCSARTMTSCRHPSRPRHSAATCAGRGCARAPPPGCRDRPPTCAPRSCAGSARAAGRSSRHRRATPCCWAARSSDARARGGPAAAGRSPSARSTAAPVAARRRLRSPVGGHRARLARGARLAVSRGLSRRRPPRRRRPRLRAARTPARRCRACRSACRGAAPGPRVRSAPRASRRSATRPPRPWLRWPARRSRACRARGRSPRPRAARPPSAVASSASIAMTANSSPP